MNLKYLPSPEHEAIVYDLIEKLGFDYINPEQVKCVISHNSSSKRVIARLHPSLRVFSYAFETKPLYIIELVHEKFKKLSEEEQLKVLIHELLHIPKTFSGAARDHSKMGKLSKNGKMSKYLNSGCRTIESLFSEYCKITGKTFQPDGLFSKIKRILN